MSCSTTSKEPARRGTDRGPWGRALRRSVERVARGRATERSAVELPCNGAFAQSWLLLQTLFWIGSKMGQFVTGKRKGCVGYV